MARCSECGFLAIRNGESRNLEELEFGSRQSGEIDEHKYIRIPVCFVMTVSLDKEAKELRQLPQYKTGQNNIDWNALTKEMLNKERKCESFTEWHQGYTPKEHREMLDRQEWRDWQAKQRKEDKRWRMIELIVFGIISVLVAGGFTLLGAFISRGGH